MELLFDQAFAIVAQCGHLPMESRAVCRHWRQVYWEHGREVIVARAFLYVSQRIAERPTTMTVFQGPYQAPPWKLLQESGNRLRSLTIVAKYGSDSSYWDDSRPTADAKKVMMILRRLHTLIIKEKRSRLFYPLVRCAGHFPELVHLRVRCCRPCPISFLGPGRCPALRLLFFHCPNGPHPRLHPLQQLMTQLSDCNVNIRNYALPGHHTEIFDYYATYANMRTCVCYTVGDAITLVKMAPELEKLYLEAPSTEPLLERLPVPKSSKLTRIDLKGGTYMELVPASRTRTHWKLR